MKRVLIVEDESLVALETAETVESFGFSVAGICSRSEEAVQKAKELRPDILLMDIHLKERGNGIEAAKRIFDIYQPAVIFLTAYSDTEHIEQAMEIEPLGYLVKPIFPRELYALLILACKRAEDHQPKTILILDDEFTFDTLSEQLMRNGSFVRLSRRETQLLSLLIRSKNRIVSLYEMENAIWPDKLPNENTRRSLISRLRAKLDNRFIETIPSVGYRFLF